MNRFVHRDPVGRLFMHIHALYCTERPTGRAHGLNVIVEILVRV